MSPLANINIHNKFGQTPSLAFDNDNTFKHNKNKEHFSTKSVTQ